MIHRFMRILILFDLPMVSKKDKKQYTDFRRFLIRDGYSMVQYSVYARICPNLDTVQTHIKRLEMSAPEHGAVRSIVVTNKQYAEAKIITGKWKPQEKMVREQQISLF